MQFAFSAFYGVWAFLHEVAFFLVGLVGWKNWFRKSVICGKTGASLIPCNRQTSQTFMSHTCISPRQSLHHCSHLTFLSSRPQLHVASSRQCFVVPCWLLTTRCRISSVYDRSLAYTAISMLLVDMICDLLELQYDFSFTSGAFHR